MDVVKSLKSLVNVENIQIVNNVFKLHYKFTMPLLIIFSIVLTSKQYFGNPIICHTDDKIKKIIEAYCYLKGTFILQNTIKGN